MEFEIDQSRFLAALSLAQTVADKRGTMPVLANVLLRANADGSVVCSATDMMTSLTETVSAEVKTPGSLTVGVKHLHGVVRTLSSGAVRINGLDNHWVQIVAGRSEFKLMGMPESDFPELPDASGGKSELEYVDVPAHALGDLIAKTHFSVSSDEARVNLNGVLFECDGENGIMVSTDGHRLTKFELPLPGPKLDKGIIIPRKGMLEIRRVLDRVSGEVSVAVTDQHMFVRAADLTLSVKLNNVTFPPYRAVIPAAFQRFAQLGRDELLKALRRAEVMAPEKTATVRVSLQPGKLELTADNPDLGVAHQELPVDYDGDELTAGFNARYLIEVLDVIDTQDVRLEFQGELDPCVVKPVDGPDFLGVVMPMRI
ncbi:MAG: DNA polymerase III subunit beta [Myxococcota bacterium]